MAGEMVTVATFRFAHEAELARLHLAEVGITAYIADAETVAMDWLLSNAIGNVKLQVAAKDAEEAAALLAQAEEMRLEDRLPDWDDEDDEEDTSVCLACGEEIPEDETKCPGCGWSYEDED
jgi:hypothetical protein